MLSFALSSHLGQMSLRYAHLPINFLISLSYLIIIVIRRPPKQEMRNMTL